MNTLTLIASIEIINESHFEILSPIAEFHIKTSNDLDKFIRLCNSDLGLDDKLMVLTKRGFAKYK